MSSSAKQRQVELHEFIRQKVEAGASDREIAFQWSDRTGRKPNRQYITKIRNVLGLPSRYRRRADARVTEVINAARRSPNPFTIAEEVGVSVKYVYELAKKHSLRVGVRDPICLRQDAFSRSDNPAAAYWAGFISGDGCLVTPRTSQSALKITVTITDRKQLEHLRQWINWTGRIRDGFTSCDGQKHPCSIVHITSDTLVADLSTIWGITSPKESGRPPVRISRDMIPHFMRGLLDADGTIHLPPSGAQSARYVRIVTGSFEMAQWIQNVARPEPRIYEQVPRNASHKTLYHVQWSGHRPAYYFLDWVYRDSNYETRLLRKYEKWLALSVAFHRDGYGMKTTEHGNAVLRAQQVVEIRKLHANGRPQAVLANQFGVCRSTIHNIVRGKSWLSTKGQGR